MNYSKLITENHNRLFVRSMNKTHQITHLSFNEAGHNHLFWKESLIGVFGLNDLDDVSFLAKQYGGDTSLTFSNAHTEDKPYLNMYMQAFDGNYYQIAAVFTDVAKANAFMTEREDTGLIDSTKLGLDNEYHFIGRLVKSKVITKST